MLKLKKLIPRHLIEGSLRLADVDKAIDTLSEKCPIALEMFARKEFFYRGSKGRGGDQSDLYRRDNSKEGTTRPEKYRPTKDAANNIVHLMFSNLPSWKDIPKREYSTMFTMDQEPAHEYGTIFYVLPEGDPLIAWGQAADNYDNYDANFRKVFPNTLMSIEHLTRLMADIMSSVVPDFDVGSLTPDNIVQQMEALDTAAKSMSEDEFSKKMREVAMSFLHYREEDFEIYFHYKERLLNLMLPLLKIRTIGIVNFLDNIFDVEKNKIKVAHLHELTKKIGVGEDDSEMWAESAIWMVSQKMANAIFRKLTGKWLDNDDGDFEEDDSTEGFGDLPPEDDGKI